MPTKNKFKMTPEERLSNIVESLGTDYTVIEQLTEAGSRSFYKVRCKRGHEFTQHYTKIMNGNRCPECKVAPKYEMVGEQYQSKSGSVITIVERVASGKCLCVCSVCHQDKELFPEPVPMIYKNVKAGVVSCGCSKRPSWTKEQWEIRIKRMYTGKADFIGWVDDSKWGKHDRIKLKCIHDGYEWDIKPTGGGCPKCAGQVGYTEESALSTIVSLGKELNFTVIERTSDFIGCGTSYSIVCNNDGYSRTIKLGKKPSRCPICQSGVLDEPALNYKLNTLIGDIYEWSYIVFNGARTKLDLRCKLDGCEWSTEASAIIAGNRCPSCAEHGFNPDKPAYLYLNAGRTIDDIPFVKFGITRQPVTDRVRQQYRSSTKLMSYDNIYSMYFDSGYDARRIETILSGISSERLDSSYLPDGFTETIVNGDVDELISIIENNK